MNEEQRPKPRKQGRIVLPFEKKPTDIGSWTYEHKVGLCVMIIAYLIVGIVFLSAKIIISHPSAVNTIFIEMEQTPEPPPEQLTPEQRQQMEDELRNVRNMVSNENAKAEVTPEKVKGAITQDLTDAAEAVAEKVAASREAYEKGLREEQQMIDEFNNRHRKQGSEGKAEKQQDVKIKGNVIVSFSLDGRTAVYLYKPAYQCEGGGEVVVSIVVNRNGKVTDANIQSTSTSENCINERALEAAKRSRFNADGSVPDKQKGTITYLFVPQ